MKCAPTCAILSLRSSISLSRCGGSTITLSGKWIFSLCPWRAPNFLSDHISNYNVHGDISMPPDLPKISIVTPSYNQGRFIEKNIRSIHEQDYPSIEHIVIDGGSTDETLRILDAHRARFAKVVVENDEGQYHAINKGFVL